MFRDLFRNRLFIGILVLLICAAMSIYFLQTDTPKAPIKIYTPVEPIAKQPPKVGDTSQGGHFHDDGTWHAEPHAQDANVLPSEAELKDFASNFEMSEAETEEFYRSLGLEPPPAGYTYIQNEDGSTELIKDGVPMVEIHSRQGFDTVYLSDEDWTLYQALKGMTHENVIETRNIPAEVVEIARERLAAFEAKAQGPILTATTTTISSGPLPSQQEENRITDAKIAEAYRALGITPELRNSRSRNHMDYDLIEQLIAEFKEETR